MSHHRHADALDADRRTRARAANLDALRSEAVTYLGTDPRILLLGDFAARAYADAGFPNGVTFARLLYWLSEQIARGE